MESQKRTNYHNEFDRLQGATTIRALHPNVKERMTKLQHKARQSLNTETHSIYKTRFLTYFIIYRTWNLIKNEHNF